MVYIHTHIGKGTCSWDTSGGRGGGLGEERRRGGLEEGGEERVKGERDGDGRVRGGGMEG